MINPDSLQMLILALTAGCLIGGFLAWLILRSRFVSLSALNKSYVHNERLIEEQARSARFEEQAASKERELRDLTEVYAGVRRDNEHYSQRLKEQKQELQMLREHFEKEFQVVAGRMLEEKSERFSKRQNAELTQLLNPLKERIQKFEEGVIQRIKEDAEDRGMLKQQIAGLTELNTQMSKEARALTSALKGDTKVQGDWGELRLELILEKAGLSHKIHYETQASLPNEEYRQKRPDVVVNLPDGKHLIIDSKVSLTAYEQYYQATDPAAQRQLLKSHADSIKRHITDLSSKNYQHLPQLNSPDYILLFIPIEPALTLALQSDQSLFLKALEKNVVLVTASTLLATMRTVSFIWTQEKQKQNVLEIAKESGKLYDTLCAFVGDLEAIGQRLSQAAQSYEKAKTKLNSPSRYGGSILGRAEKIRKLGAKTSRELPRHLLPDMEEE